MGEAGLRLALPTCRSEALELVVILVGLGDGLAGAAAQVEVLEEKLGLGLDRSREDDVDLGLVSLDSELPIALGTAQGVVKRVAPGGYPSRPDFEIIALKPGDEVIGVAQGPDSEELVFVTTDAQLLRYAASAVRPQGVAAGGMAGINLSAKARAMFFTSVDPGADIVVATISTPAVVARRSMGRCWLRPVAGRLSHASASACDPRMRVARATSFCW